MLFLPLAVSVLLSLFTTVNGAAQWKHFNYDPSDSEHGPSHWGASCGSVVRQSPINIVKKEVIYGQKFVTEYDSIYRGLEGNLANNGHSTSFKLNSTAVPILTVAGVQGLGDQTFGLSSIHFHFGPSNTIGSEHTLDGQSYPAEMHLVHVNTKYDTLDEALANPDGLAVIGVFLKVGRRSNSEFAKICRQMKLIKTKDAQVPLTVTFDELLPSLNEMYSYAGSLTTPPCSEVVQWFVAKETMTITPRQLSKLRMLKTGNRRSPRISKFGNFRPIKPTLGRTVMANFAPTF